ncbi:PIN domain-containing protein [Microbacterium sp.]|uniref:PIN domain-containing protein n=1 Tax=Microbacterium sp. TaxID=51671 RepID=UPI0039E32A6B
MSVFFDTNVLAYQLDDSQLAKQRRAREIFAERAADAVISTQVMIELHAVLTRKFRRSRDQAMRMLSALDVDVVPTDAALVLAAAATASAHQLSIFDALVLEAAVSAGCAELWSEDLTDGATLRGVRIVNPFRAL